MPVAAAVRSASPAGLGRAARRRGRRTRTGTPGATAAWPPASAGAPRPSAPRPAGAATRTARPWSSRSAGEPGQHGDGPGRARPPDQLAVVGRRRRRRAAPAGPARRRRARSGGPRIAELRRRRRAAARRAGSMRWAAISAAALAENASASLALSVASALARSLRTLDSIGSGVSSLIGRRLRPAGSTTAATSGQVVGQLGRARRAGAGRRRRRTPARPSPAGRARSRGAGSAGGPAGGRWSSSWPRRRLVVAVHGRARQSTHPAGDERGVRALAGRSLRSPTISGAGSRPPARRERDRRLAAAAGRPRRAARGARRARRCGRSRWPRWRRARPAAASPRTVGGAARNARGRTIAVAASARPGPRPVVTTGQCLNAHRRDGIGQARRPAPTPVAAAPPAARRRPDRPTG